MIQESIWDLIGLADQAYERGGYQQAIGLYESAVAQSLRGGQERAGLVALIRFVSVMPLFRIGRIV